MNVPLPWRRVQKQRLGRAQNQNHVGTQGAGNGEVQKGRMRTIGRGKDIHVMHGWYGTASIEKAFLYTD